MRNEGYLVETQVSSRLIHQGNIVGFREDTVLLSNGKTVTRDVVIHRGAVAMAAFLPSGELLLERQYRHPVGEVLWEIPAGGLKAGEDPDAAAVRELEEETGYHPKKVSKMVGLFPAPAWCEEILHLYLCEELEPIERRLDEDEFLEVYPVTPECVRELIDSGQIRDAKTIAAFYLAQDWRNRRG